MARALPALTEHQLLPIGVHDFALARRSREGHREDRAMIKTDQDLEIVRQQLTRVESAFGALRREVLPESEERFLLMAETYVDQILALRAEIDEYLGLDLVFRKRAAVAPGDHAARQSLSR